MTHNIKKSHILCWMTRLVGSDGYGDAIEMAVQRKLLRKIKKIIPLDDICANTCEFSEGDFQFD